MSTSSRRARERELEAAKVLGVRRVHRSRYESAPDLEPVTLPCGVTLTVEVKTRAALPALVRDAIAQAAKYLPGAVPACVLSQTGGEAMIVLPLRVFAEVAGLRDVSTSQLVLGRKAAS